MKEFGMTTPNTEYNVTFEPYQAQDGEEYMNDAQLAHFRKILLAWKTA